MAVVSGSWVPTSTGDKRMCLVITYNVPTPTLGQSSVTVTGSIAVKTRYSFNDSDNTFKVGGTLGPSYSGAKSIDVADGSQTIHTFSQVVSLASGSQTKTLTASLTGVNYVGASVTASVTANISIPARVITVPNTPASMSVTRQGDASHVLGWVATATTDRPIDKFELQFWRQSTNSWGSVGIAAGTSRAWTNGTNYYNDSVQWRVRAINSAGASGWATSPRVWTTPAAPTNVKVTRSGTSATLTWTNNHRAAVKVGVRSQSSSDGGATWTSMTNLAGHIDLPPGTTSRTITGLDNAKLWRFDVVSAVTTPNNLYGISAPSNILQLLSPPLAPTVVAPTGVVSDQSPVTSRWRHNPVDTTDQTGFQHRRRLAGGSWTTYTGSNTSAEYYSMPLSAGLYEWQVCTKGQHASYGPWSTIASFTVATPPAVTITAPAGGAVLTSNKLKITFAYSDSQDAAMTSWRASLLDSEGQTLETRTGKTGNTTTFNTPLVNTSTYTVEMSVMSGTGLASDTTTATFTTAFTPPPPATLTGVWSDPDGVVILSVANSGGTPPAVRNRIERLDGDVWVTVVDDVPLNASANDWTAPLNTSSWYRAVSISALDVETEGTPVEVFTSSKRVWLFAENGDAAFIELSLSIRGSYGHNVVTEQYLGDDKPTAYFGVARPTEVGVTGKFSWRRGSELGKPFKQFLGQPVYYRDPTGRAFWAVVAADGFQSTQSTYRSSDLSFTVEEVEHV